MDQSDNSAVTRKASTIAVNPDFSHFDSARDILRDAAQWGLLDELRQLLHSDPKKCTDSVRLIRDIAYEFAGAENRDFAVDLFIHVTGLAEFGPNTLRDYARKHGCTPEWFRQKAEAMRKRLDLPPLVSQRPEALRAQYRLSNRRNHAA